MAESRNRLSADLKKLEDERSKHLAAVSQAEQEGKARLQAIANEQNELAVHLEMRRACSISLLKAVQNTIVTPYIT